MNKEFKEKTDHDDGWLPAMYGDDVISIHLSDWNDNDRACLIGVSTLKWLIKKYGNKPKQFAARLWDCCSDWVVSPRAQCLEETELFYQWEDWGKIGSYDEMAEAVEENWPDVAPEEPTTIYTLYKEHMERWEQPPKKRKK